MNRFYPSHSPRHILSGVVLGYLYRRLSMRPHPRRPRGDHDPPRSRPCQRIRDISPLLAQPRPRFMASNPGYVCRVFRRHISNVLCFQTYSRYVVVRHRNIHRPYRMFGGMLRIKPIFTESRTHMASDLCPCEYSPGRKCGEFCPLRRDYKNG
jgi:hypothetical protein